MAKTFEFEQTSISMQFSINLRDRLMMNWVDTRTADFYRHIFAAVTDVLKINQSKNNPRIGFSLKDDKGVFKFGAILNYQKPEEDAEEDTGNWYLEFTFNSEDMTDLDLDLDNHSDVFVRCAAQEAYNICFGRFKSTEFLNSMYCCAFDTLKDFLDANAVEGESVDVSLRGIFTASVEVENGIKIISIVPGEFVKQSIKNDSAL